MKNKQLSWWQKIIAPIVLCTTTVLFYFPSLGYPFTFDDFPQIIDNWRTKCPDLFGFAFAWPRWICDIPNQFSYKSHRNNKSNQSSIANQIERKQLC